MTKAAHATSVSQLELPSFALWDMVEVEWQDSISAVSRWTSTSEVDWKDIAAAMRHKTVGYVAHDCPDFIALAASYQDKWDKDGPHFLTDTIAIPRAVIRRLRVIRRAKLNPKQRPVPDTPG